jgi:hypothetical protein
MILINIFQEAHDKDGEEEETDKGEPYDSDAEIVDAREKEDPSQDQEENLIIAKEKHAKVPPKRQQTNLKPF